MVVLSHVVDVIHTVFVLVSEDRASVTLSRKLVRLILLCVALLLIHFLFGFDKADALEDEERYNSYVHEKRSEANRYHNAYFDLADPTIRSVVKYDWNYGAQSVRQHESQEKHVNSSLLSFKWEAEKFIQHVIHMEVDNQEHDVQNNQYGNGPNSIIA